MRQVAALAAERPAIDFLAVTHSTEAPSRRCCEAFGGPGGVQLIADPDRARYVAWGVGLSVSWMISFAATLGFLAICLTFVWWVFRTGYKLKT